MIKRHTPALRLVLSATLLVVLASISIAQTDVPADPDERPVIAAIYFGEVGCLHCDTFVTGTVPKVEERLGVDISVDAHDILNASGYARCVAELEERGRAFRTYPVLIIGSNAYQGKTVIAERLTEEIEYFLANGAFRETLPPSLDGSLASDGQAAAPLPGTTDRLRLVPILLAGLADGVNPCAFSTLLFLISLLSLFGRNRREIIIVGLSYTVTIFITYLALGFGLLTILRQAVLINTLRTALRIVVTAAAAVVAGLSIRDAVRIRRGRAFESVLQLSLKAKQRIHSAMRSGLRRGSLIAGSIGAAFTVSIVELACTGQLYFPTIAYLVQTDSTTAGELAALALYNLAFIIPLVAVFVATLLGLRSDRLNKWFGRHAAASKLVTAGAMVVLALFMWLV